MLIIKEGGSTLGYRPLDCIFAKTVGAVNGGRSIPGWLKAEKVRDAEKELSHKRRLLLKICGFHKF